MNVPVVDSNIKANRETTRLSICRENASRQEISITDITVRMDREDPGTPAKKIIKNTQLTHSLQGNFVCFLFADFVIEKKSYRNTISASNSLNPDQAGHIVRPNLCPNCLQSLSADNNSHQKRDLDLSLLFFKISSRQVNLKIIA